MTLCQRCKKRQPFKDERYCYFCRRWILREMGMAGYFQPLARPSDKALRMGSGFSILKPGE